MRRLATVCTLAVAAAVACDDQGTAIRGPIARCVLSDASPPAFGDVPFPSDAYLVGGHVSVPGMDHVFPKDGDVIARGLTALDGFSRIAYAMFWVDDTSAPEDDGGAPAPAAIDPTTLPVGEAACGAGRSSAFLLDATTGVRVPCRAELHDDSRWGSTTRPMVAVGPARGIVLAPGHPYIAVLTSRVRDLRGRPLAPAPDARLVRDGSRSGTLGALYGHAFDMAHTALSASLAADGAEVVAVAPFTTSALDRELHAMRATLGSLPAPKLAWDAASIAPMGAARFARPVGGALPAGFTASLDDWLGVVAPAAKLPDGHDDPDDGLPVRAHDAIAAVGTAVFDATSFLEERPGGYTDPSDATVHHDASGNPAPPPDHPTAKIWVTFAIPSAPMPPGGYPAVIAQHGLSGSRLWSLDLFNPFCARGWIGVAIDSITFGARAPEAMYQVDRHTSWESAPGAKYHGPDGLADEVNGSTNGPIDLFGQMVNLAAMRDQFRQASIDTASLVKVLRSDPDLSLLATGGVVPHVDPARIAYVGDSLGSIQGATSAAIEPDVSAWFLNVGGGGVITEIAPNAPGIGQLIGAAGLLYFGFKHDFFTASHPLNVLVQTALGPGDPISFASELVTAPVPIAGQPARRRNVVLTEVLYDELVANEGGEALARAAGFPLAVPNAGSNAGIRDIVHLDANVDRLHLPQAAPGPDGAIRGAPMAGVTAVVVQTSPGQHGFDLVRRHATHHYGIPYAEYAEGTPFITLAKTFDVRDAYLPLQATMGGFFADAFAGRVPGVAGFQAPVRDFDDDGATDDVDPDPNDPSVH